MAGRPIKTKLDYFPLDVDYFNDRKFKRIRSEYGFKSEGIAIRVFNEVYKNGYYAEYTEDFNVDIADDTGFKPSFISAVVSAMVRCGFFDEGLYRNERILTSKGIQKRWLIACEKRKKPELVYWLLDKPEEGGEVISYDINSIYDPGNYTKEKKRKEIRTDILSQEGNSAPAHVSFDDVRSLFVEYYGKRNMQKLFSLCEQYGYDSVFNAIDTAGDRAKMNPIKYIEQMLFVEQECKRA